ncbi:MAG: hypothetical protein ACM362_05890 [Candidatus Methylomirabilota bacterium]
MRNSTGTFPEATADLLDLLNSIKARFEPADTGVKLAILQILAGREIAEVTSLILFHEILCFLRAYPDSLENLHWVEKSLEQFPARVDLVKERRDLSDLKRLTDTGIAHTTVYYAYPYPMATWLVEHYPDAVEIDWEDADGLDKIRSVLPLLVAYAENDALDDERLSLRDWIGAARGNRKGTGLRWLLEALGRSPLPRDVIQHLYEDAELLLGWELREPAASRTGAKFPTDRIFCHQGPLLRGHLDFPREIQKPLPGMKPVPRKTAEGLIHLFTCALAVRNRELHPLLYADSRDVFLADVGRGLRIILVGVTPEYRLPLEAYYSFLVLKNGVPVSYGGGGPLFDRLEIAGNIFETFRQGESVHIFGQVFRTYRQLCGSRYFLVPRYQVGYENEEALQSGAFWFYHKVGFRPVERRVLALSEEEQRKIKADPAYRSPRKTLERLAQSDMVLTLDGDGGNPPRDLHPGNIGLRVTREISEKFADNRLAAVRETTHRVSRVLGCTGWRRWPAPQRSAMERLAPILALIPDLERWTSAEKRGLIRVIRAKGAERQAAYIRLLQGHRRLAHSLYDLADSVKPGTPPRRQSA